MNISRAIIAAAISSSLAVPVFGAGNMDHADHNSLHAAPANASLTDGQVKKVDKAGGKLTVAHGPLPNGMSGMTMAFRVKDAAWLNNVKEGQKIRFALDDKMTIVHLEPIQ